MNRKTLCRLSLLGALTLASPAALACGDGMFNTGKGLAYQSYLAPRPAAVLVYADPGESASDAKREALYAGLKKAGHTITVVRDADAMRRAIGESRYDVVISSLDGIDAIAAVEGVQSRLLPVVARSARNSPEVKNRFDLFLIDGASLGQYLRAINQSITTRI